MIGDREKVQNGFIIHTIDDYALGTLFIDWSKRKFEVDGVDGSSGLSEREVWDFMEEPVTEDQERWALVCWTLEDGCTQLAIHDVSGLSDIFEPATPEALAELDEDDD